MKKLLIIIVFLIISVFSFSQEIYDIKINNLILYTNTSDSTSTAKKFRYFIKPNIKIYNDSLVVTKGGEKSVYKFITKIDNDTPINEYVGINVKNNNEYKVVFFRSLCVSETFITVMIENKEHCFYYNCDIIKNN